MVAQMYVCNSSELLATNEIPHVQVREKLGHFPHKLFTVSCKGRLMSQRIK